ncbi:MAG TPA: PDZ domain-containing protein, partial [Terricaulis sp.]|nr:PDZ domain-containing protein [Terricaulis sp.]
QPTSPVSSLSDARVFVLTGRTGSACEHLSQALRETGRATLIGSNTGGAGHYGGARIFGDGRFEMFLPVGNSYAPGAESWEGVGVAPHIRVDPANALNVALREAGLDETLASAVAPPTRMYGIAMGPPQAGAAFITIDQVIPGHVAAASGLRSGDRIIAVNGRPVRELSEEAFGAAMRGQRLTLDIERAGERLSFNLSLT